VISLQRAFEGLTTHTTLPGLNTSLLDSAKLTVLPTTGYADNISHVAVDLKNPFTYVTIFRVYVLLEGLD
jgi:hypothetical protein